MSNRINTQNYTLFQNKNQKKPLQTYIIKPPQVTGSNAEEKRKVSVIQTSVRGMQKYHKRIRGQRSQTKQLNIHMKTLNQKYLKHCLMTNELQEEDKVIYNKYKQINANFQSTKFLFQSISHQVKEQYRNYARSSNIVKDILLSDRMFINNKIIFIKFLKKVESGIDVPNVSWKSLYFHKNSKNFNQKNQQEKVSIGKSEKKDSSPHPQEKSQQKHDQSLKISHSIQKINIIVQNNYKTNINININNGNAVHQSKRDKKQVQQQSKKAIKIGDSKNYRYPSQIKRQNNSQ